MGYAFWVGLVSWLGDHAPPLVAGFCGGLVGSLVIDFRRHRTERNK